MGYVYLILQTDSNYLESFKIGITKNQPEIRVKQLQTGNPNKISLLKSYKSDNYLKIERWLHRKHGMTKTEASNEWRYLTNESIDRFITDCEEADDTFNFLFENNSLFE
jgi:hypothetical protein